MIVAFVSGPYRSSTVYGIKQNIRKAEDASVELMKEGFAALCPHTMCAFNDGLLPDEFYLSIDIEFLKRSDVVFLVDGWKNSSGTIGEVKLALELGIPVIELSVYNSFNTREKSLVKEVLSDNSPKKDIINGLISNLGYFTVDKIFEEKTKKDETA